MKITQKNQFGLNIIPEMVESCIKSRYDGGIKYLPKGDMTDKLILLALLFEPDMPLKYPWESELMQAVSKNSDAIAMQSVHFNYMPTKSALDIVDRIKVDADKFDYRFLAKVKTKLVTFLLGPTQFYRYLRWKNLIFVVYMEINPNVKPVPGKLAYNYQTFGIDVQDNGVDMAGKDGFNTQRPMDNPVFMKFLKLLIFTELSELEVVELKPNGKSTDRSSEKHINGSLSNVTIVDSAWNRTSIRTDGFAVRGHFRLQACGKEFMDRKLVYIDEFEKNGYIRRARGHHETK